MPIDGGGGGGSQPEILLATTTLTSAQILDLATTAVPVTPTPAVGTGIMVLQVWSKYHFATAAYTGTDSLVVAPNFRGYTNFKAATGSLLAFTFDVVTWWDQSGDYNTAALEYDHTDLIGSPWSMKDDTSGGSPPATGDGTLTVYCAYAVIAA